ncbi:MAG: alpha/beta hydrolase [Burkholderiales bacterium]|nr:alpha/beta hydrolase [Burkholderiales bacterium]
MKHPKKWLALLYLSIAVMVSACGGGSSDSTTSTATVTTLGETSVIIDGTAPGDPKESIYVRKVGHGPKTIFLVPGNNTSGQTFEGMLGVFSSVDAFNDAYTVYTFDYRGSGKSSYNKKVASLKDFATDFEKVMNKIADFPTSGVTLVGYSMGFGVALEMAIANPGRYANIVGLAGIGTRGIRVSFNAGQAGTDSAGQTWAAGDWLTVSDDAKGVVGAEFQQRVWQGEQRTYTNVKNIWDMLVYNDVLKYDITKAFTAAAITDSTFTTSPNYSGSLLDGLRIQYMPESLYYAHKFNVSRADVIKPTANANGVSVVIKADNRLGTLLTGKNALLVKASTDFATWRGDQVVYDNYTATSKYDLKQAGANVNAVMINPNQGFDHGFPVARPLEAVKLIDTFIKGTLSASTASTALSGATVAYYPNSETTWETNTFTGF